MPTVRRMMACRGLSCPAFRQTDAFLSYDNDLRLSNMSLAATSGGTTLYATSRGYDAVGNLASVSTTLAAGTDQQAFCYDEQNRLVWASSQSATGPCGRAKGQHRRQPLQRRLHGDLRLRRAQPPDERDGQHCPGQLHLRRRGVSARVDRHQQRRLQRELRPVAADLTCRAPSAVVTFAEGSPTGAVLGYDNEQRLVSWASAPSKPGATATWAFDGEGHRVAQSVTASGNTTTTYYVAGLEEQANSGGALSYVATDALGSVLPAVVLTPAHAASGASRSAA
jgi:hypothetical protein